MKNFDLTTTTSIPSASVDVPRSSPLQATLALQKSQLLSFFSMIYTQCNHDRLLVSCLCLAEHQIQASLHHLQPPF